MMPVGLQLAKMEKAICYKNGSAKFAPFTVLRRISRVQVAPVLIRVGGFASERARIDDAWYAIYAGKRVFFRRYKKSS